MYKICSLFAGVGGIDLGFLETKKCEIAYANEFDKYAVETYEKNFNTKEKKDSEMIKLIKNIIEREVKKNDIQKDEIA